MRKVLLLVLFGVSAASYAQTGMWTWMKGDSTYLVGSYGTKGVASPSVEPRPRTLASSWYYAPTNTLWLYGGYNMGSPDTVLSDLCRYDVATNEWAWMTGTRNGLDYPNYGTIGIEAASNHPGSRLLANAWTDLQGNLWLYGGGIFNGFYQSGGNDRTQVFFGSDLWMYNVTTHMWKWVKGSMYDSTRRYGTQGVATAANSPGARTEATTWTDMAGNLWLYGGHRANDLWKYDPATNMWTWMQGSAASFPGPVYGQKGVPSINNSPGYRNQGVSWADTTGNLWLYSGGPGTGSTDWNDCYGDIWNYNIGTGMWTWINGNKGKGVKSFFGLKNVFSPSTAPGSRYGAIGAADGSGSLYMYGGFDSTDNNVLWEYSMVRNEWRWITGDTAASTWSWGIKGISSPSNLPYKSYGMNCWRETDGTFWVFGGLLYNNSLWRYEPDTSNLFPLHLISFSGKLYDKTGRLQWISENEQNFSHYEVERSMDGRQWSKVKSEKSKGGSGRNEYSCDDISGFLSLVSGSTVYYRLKMVDNDGKYSYSKVVEIKLPVNNGFSIYPNPVKDVLNLEIGSSNRKDAEIKILSADGRLLKAAKVTFEGGADNNAINVSALQAGSYFLQINTADDKQVLKFEKM